LPPNQEPPWSILTRPQKVLGFNRSICGMELPY
jgi:hypothetical protein